VFGERILSDALMNQERDKKVRQGLLLNQLDDIYATVLRQAYFVQFENQAHEMIAQGATVKDLAKTYLAEVRQQFGKGIKVPDEFQWEWLTIPHIFASPFYCYAYSFGNLLVLALYRMYQKEGAAFVPKYLDLLSTGGSEAPQTILARLESIWLLKIFGNRALIRSAVWSISWSTRCRAALPLQQEIFPLSPHNTRPPPTPLDTWRGREYY
jgi:oligoendopeptidase F